MGISRRDFLMRVGQAGGYSAAFVTMQSLGLMPMKAEAPLPIEAAPGSGKGVKIVVCGGGVGGLVTAYEAKKLGYDVTLLEARHRPGENSITLGRKPPRGILKNSLTLMVPQLHRCQTAACYST